MLHRRRLFFAWRPQLFLRCADECAARNGLLLDRLWFGSGAVEHLEEVGSLGPHARVDVRLAALDVVVQVVAEQVDQVDCVVSHGLVCVPREQHWLEERKGALAFQQPIQILDHFLIICPIT